MANSLHFSDQELSCHHGKNETKTELLTALEALRASISEARGQDTPIIVHDAYRCGECNHALKNAASRSQHMEGLAADISVAGMSAVDLEKAALTIDAFARGGIGRDDKRNYIHVDVRNNYARWCYNDDGRCIDYYPDGKEPKRTEMAHVDDRKPGELKPGEIRQPQQNDPHRELRPGETRDEPVHS